MACAFPTQNSTTSPIQWTSAASKSTTRGRHFPENTWIAPGRAVALSLSGQRVDSLQGNNVKKPLNSRGFFICRTSSSLRRWSLPADTTCREPCRRVLWFRIPVHPGFEFICPLVGNRRVDVCTVHRYFGDRILEPSRDIAGKGCRTGLYCRRLARASPLRPRLTAISEQRDVFLIGDLNETRSAASICNTCLAQVRCNGRCVCHAPHLHRRCDTCGIVNGCLCRCESADTTLRGLGQDEVDLGSRQHERGKTRPAAAESAVDGRARINEYARTRRTCQVRGDVGSKKSVRRTRVRTIILIRLRENWNPRVVVCLHQVHEHDRHSMIVARLEIVGPRIVVYSVTRPGQYGVVGVGGNESAWRGASSLQLGTRGGWIHVDEPQREPRTQGIRKLLPLAQITAVDRISRAEIPCSGRRGHVLAGLVEHLEEVGVNELLLVILGTERAADTVTLQGLEVRNVAPGIGQVPETPGAQGKCGPI